MSLTADFLTAIRTRDSSVGVWYLLEIDHADLAAPIRVCNNHEPIVNGGHVWQPFAFRIALPSELDERSYDELTLEIDNTDRAAVEAVRSIATPATVSLSMVSTDSPDVIEIGPVALRMGHVSWDASRVHATLTADAFMADQFPAHEMTRETVPGAAP